jgi:hypothetical protein
VKKAIVLVVVLSVFLVGCGSPRTLGEGSARRQYPTYGVFNEDTSRSNNVCYEVSAGNVVWSIILVETIVAPVYFIGYSIKNPVRLKKDANDSCNSF